MGDYQDQILRQVGNWRDHPIVPCAVCRRLMSWYIEPDTGVCNECRIKETETETETEANK